MVSSSEAEKLGDKTGGPGEIQGSKFRVRSSENLELRSSNPHPSRSSRLPRPAVLRAVLLWVTERPHISQHLPGFFFRQYEWNKRSHRRSLAAILHNPE